MATHHQPSSKTRPLAAWLLLLLPLSTAVHALASLAVIFESSTAWPALAAAPRACTTGGWSAAVKSPCGDKECFCADAQFMADTTDECLSIRVSNIGDKTAFSVQNYNAIMAFWGGECGFKPQFKEAMTQKVTYTKTYSTAVQTTPAANKQTTTTSGAQGGAGLTTTTDATSTATDTPSSSGGGGNGGGGGNSDLSIGGIIGIVAGVATVISTIVGVVMCYRRKNQ
ncbi:hypothetical protein B0T26DRAFT_868773 [Lasiosphaeria miniovina]|uniref:Extracellular membrane protein CFEM domain-containing protein n=1 Tax=Lasiosphaeria miniovina TaxID=1954250 RepID=A0AA40B4F8_9PEZI|nr:uncharacterized protein B0T26DRAFT_868773 [Lasiosphaeria miniovina]KAK0727486.1 hypothetical protein B0T26DRAFT_868773 [Lasiosphaeria miniovina]